MDVSTVTTIAAILLVGFVLARTYNRVIRSRVRCEEAWSGIDVQLQRRANLVPALVETVQAYAGHERGVLEAVARARAGLRAARGPAEATGANLLLTAALGRLVAVAEDYPELKASAGFLELQAQLGDIEEKIAYARQFYNRNVLDHNTRIRSFPTLLVARLMGFRAMEFFEADAADPSRLAFRDSPEDAVLPPSRKEDE
jgi:LemA protein